MKKLLFIALLFSACSKDDPAEPVCKTCDVNVTHRHFYTNGSSVTDKYIESSTKYCNGDWTKVDGQTSYWKYNGDEISKKTTCK